MSKPKSLEFVINLLETVDKHGIDAVHGFINEGKQKIEKDLTVKIDFIIKTVGSIFGFKKNDILISRTKYDRTDALAICFYISNKKLQLNGTQIAKIFNKSLSQVSRGIKKIKNLNSNHPADKAIKEKYKQVLDVYEQQYSE